MAEGSWICPDYCCLSFQGPFIFLSYVVLSKEVRKALKFACSRKPSPDPALTTKSTLTSVRALALRSLFVLYTFCLRVLLPSPHP